MKLYVIALAAIALLLGCGSSWFAGSVAREAKIANSIPATATHIDKASAYTGSAETAVKAATPHADPTGVSLLGIVSKAHASVGTELDGAKTELGAAQRERDEYAAALKQTRADAAAQLDLQQARIRSLLGSAAYRIGSAIVWAAGVLLILAIAHVVLVALSMVVWSGAPICALVANIINPLGWLSWLATHVQARRQLGQVVGAPVSK